MVRSRPSQQKPSSFGVYLGSFGSDLTPAQERLLTQWDILIVDPLQSGVVDAISQRDRMQVLGRVDLARLVSLEAPKVTIIEKIEEVIVRHFNGTAFAGILLANWDEPLSPSIQKALFEAIQTMGLLVYLETGPPHFLKNRKALQSSAVSGLVIRNASIMPRGEKRDYFQMTELQPTIKAFVSESCMRDFVVMAWETVDDDVTPSNAIVRRTLQWCNFYSTITWIGPEAALQNAEVNEPLIEPLPAFGWLKEADVMKSHDIWRSNLRISQSSGVQSGWDTLRSFFPLVNDLLESANYESKPRDSPASRLRDPPEWVAQVKSQGSPLSVSMSGQEYNRLGCFPLGSDPTALAYAEILQSQQRLKALGLLHPVPEKKVKEIGKLLHLFRETLGISNDGHLGAAVKELADFATNETLRVSLALDSGLRKSTDCRFWAVHQIEDRKSVV